MTLDMTRGRPFGLLVRFALPLMLSSLLQQLYTMCDSVIVGQLLGTEAFAAIGSAAYLHWFPLSMVLGATGGFGVALAQRFGAKDREGFSRFFGAAILLTLIISALMTVLGVGFIRPLLVLLGTPPELTGYAEEYTRFLWSGMLLIGSLNILIAALRAMGDSRTPFLSLIVSTVLNIMLDFLFLGAFRMGVAGAALATLLSEAAAIVWCLRGVIRARALPARRDYALPRREVRELLRLGMPQLLAQGVISTGELAVLAAINTFGVVYVTGTTAARRYFSLFNVVGGALESAIGTYAGQNWGAGEKKRVLQGTRTGVLMGMISSVTLAVLIGIGAPHLIRLFIPDGSADALRIGVEALRAELLFLPALYLLCEHRAAIQGMGNAIIPMFSGFLELVLRLVAAWMLPLAAGSTGLYFTDAVTWTVTAIFLILCWHLVMKRRLKT